MRRPVYDTAAPRRTVSLTINADLMARAKAEAINVSAIAERALAAELTERVRARLIEELKRGAEAHDAFVAEHGSFADQVRAHLEAEEAEAKPRRHAAS